MAGGTTDRYGLTRLGAGQHFQENGYKYTDADRDQIDRVLYIGAESHRHTGQPRSSESSLIPLALASYPGVGSIPAGTRVYYKYTLVDANGLESLPSAEAYVDTPEAIDEPAAPVLNVTTTGGIMLPGNYYYVLSAYTNFVNTQETKAISPSYVTVPVGTTTNAVTLTYPTLPTGATGWNIYRKKPGASTYYYLASVNMSVATPPTAYVDTGSVAEDCNRTIPTRNSTNGTNATIVALGATPVVPDGYTWKLYRTYVGGNYDNSFLHWVVEETAEGSGIIIPYYIDFGLATYSGKPPATSQTVGTPPKIDLATEVEGTLTMASITAFPQVVEFNVAGALAAGTGTDGWVCEYPQASILGVRASLGRGYLPASTPVIVDVNVGHGTVPIMTSIFTISADQPRVLVGEQIGTRVTPTARTELIEGDVVTVDIDQAGGGATPTDRDLTVTLYLLTYGHPSTSHEPNTTLFTPAQVPGMRAWYKADAITGLANAAAVTSWIDSSGYSRNALQATSANQPTYRTNVVNGKPIVRFDGTNDFLKAAAFTLAQPLTVFVVGQANYAGDVVHYVDGDTSSTMQVARNGNLLWQMSAGTVFQNTSTGANNQFRIVAATFNGATSVLRPDGGAGEVGNAGTAAPGGITIGANGAGTADYWPGDIAEIIVYSGVLDLDDLNAIGAHLAAKYARTWNTAT